MTQRRTKAFTLIELLVVISIVALISGAVVALNNGLTTDSAITMTIATQKQLTNQVAQFHRGHGGRLPDGFDSMLRDDYATNALGAAATYTTTGPLELVDRTTDSEGKGGAPRGLIYTGFDADQDGFADEGALAKGLTIMSWSGQGVHTLTIARLNATDLAALNSLGLTHVYDIAHDQDLVDGELTRVRRDLAVGDPIVMLDPGGLGTTYDAFTQTDGLTDAEVLTNRPHFAVFGIGPNCSLIGDRRGGLQEAPVCSTIVPWITAAPSGNNGYYDRYMAVVKLPVDPQDEPAFVGVLESNGWGVHSAKIWYSRNRE
ncbi:MAG TPA: hypothetical protein DEA08_11970 [Planctomycetes bacterium]|nr:hypothetical protein [Planctomycetota bacterium]